MNFLLLSISTAVLFCYAVGAPFRSLTGNLVRTETGGGDLEPCRMFNGPATCVNEMIRNEGSTQWCSYRLCAPSYVPAKACPSSQSLQATDKCIVKETTRDIYKCDGLSFRREVSPEGCRIGTDNCKEIHTCSCKKVENYTSRMLTRETSYNPMCPSGGFTNVDCAKCGQVLECYVDSGSSTVDADVCKTILNRSLFCSSRQRTACKQQCDGKEEVKCFPGEKWGTCPAVLGSTNGAAKCKGGARGGPAALSNFASYMVASGDTEALPPSEAVSCLHEKCDSGLICRCSASKTSSAKGTMKMG